MRHTYRQTCLSNDKAHLWRLPNLHEPVPRLENPSKQGLMIIPLFESMPLHDNVNHHDALAAVWARRSWMLFSDAQNFGIDVKFYVETRVRDQAERVFAQNCVRDEDIIFFDGTPFHGSPRTRVGQKMSMFVDKQFEDYDWVFQMDADLFAMATSTKQGRKTLPFFHRFFENVPSNELAVLYISESIGSLREETTWHTRVSESGDMGDTQEWLRRAESLTSPDIVTPYRDDNQIDAFPQPQGGLVAFPSKHFMLHRPSDCTWLAHAGKLLQTDEAALSLWAAKGQPLYDIQKEGEIPVIMFSPSMDAGQFAEYKNLTESGHPFILHHASNFLEVLWREGIDAL